MARDFEDHCWRDIVSPEIMEVYRDYRREVCVGACPALLAIDLYALVYKGGANPPHEITRDNPSTCGIYAHNAIEPTKKLFAAARAAGLPIFYTTGSNGTGKVRATKRVRGAEASDDDYAIYEAFTPEEGDTVVFKERASGFYGTPLTAYLTQLGIDSVIVCGESTSGCVRASVVDGYSHGYHMSVVEECVFDRSELSHKVNLFDLHHKYADVMVLEDVLAHLATVAGNKSAA
jgi:maleamate amidohydrolase